MKARESCDESPVAMNNSDALRIGEMVEMRDSELDAWQAGIVVSLSPTMIRFTDGSEDVEGFCWLQSRPRMAPTPQSLPLFDPSHGWLSKVMCSKSLCAADVAFKCCASMVCKSVETMKLCNFSF